MNSYYKATGSRNQKRTSLHSRGSALYNNRQQNKIHFNQRKIEDNEQPLFVSNRRNISTAQNYRQQPTQELVFTSNVIHKKQPISRFNQTAKQGFRKNQERPESKQEPRNKGWNNSGIIGLKTPVIQSNRPQTSKGQRPKITYRDKPEDLSKRRISLQGQDFRNLQKRPYPIASSSSNKRGSQTGRLEFKTSIDPEFLSLFAN